MKKAISMGLATVMAVSMLAGGAVQASALSVRDEAQSAAIGVEENCISGEWVKSSTQTLKNKAKTLWNKALGREDEAGEELAGGWQKPESTELTDEAKAAFEKATEGLVGVDYKPVALLGTQVVAGTNYRILCEATVVYPGAETKEVVMTIYEDLDGNASILSIEDDSASDAQ